MTRAELNDLIKERWLRERNSGEIKWITKDGNEIPIKDMTNEHLENAINHLIEHEEYKEIAAEYSAYIEEHFG